MSHTTVLTVLTTMTAAALVLRLAGGFRESLPGPGRLAALLATLHLLSLARRNWRVAEWRRIIVAHKFAIGLFAVCVLAVVVRLPGFASDLGHTPLDIDERRLAANVKHFFDTGEVRHTHIEHYPGAVFWVFVASSFLTSFHGLTTGLTSTLSQLPVEVFVHASRLANIWVAAATVALTGLVGWHLSGPTAGLLGAVMVAIVPVSVETTVLVRNDAGMVLVVMAATYGALVYYGSGMLRWIVAAGAFAGLAAAIKYSAVFALAPVLIAAFSTAQVRGRSRAVIVGVLAFGMAVAISNHFIWKDFPSFLRQLSDQHSFTGLGHRWSTDNPASVYLMTLAWAGPGWPLVLLAAALTVYALSTPHPKLWIFISFPVAYLWFMTQRPLQVPRWVYPLVPFVAVAGVSALAASVQPFLAVLASRRTPWSRVGPFAATLAVVGVLWQPVWAGAVSFSRRINRPTHELTEAWIQEHATPQTVVLLGQGWLDLSDTHLVTRRVPNLQTALDAGIEQLGGCDWVIVPEPLFGHPVLRQLGFLQRFEADWSFGGNGGLDFEVYAVPEVATGTICG